jgi:hypothetical protein
MTTHDLAREEADSQSNDFDTSVKFEKDTSHIEGTVKSEGGDGIIAISEADNKRIGWPKADY